MKSGIDMTASYIRLEKKDAANIFLKIDFDMYMLLSEAERGVPVLFMESNLVKKVWRFVEQLQSLGDLDEDDTITISLLDIQNKKKISVTIDREEKRYSAIEGEKAKERLLSADKGVYVVKGLKDDMISFTAGSKYFLTRSSIYEDTGEFIGGLIHSYCPELAEYIKRLLDEAEDPISLLFEPVSESSLQIFEKSRHEDLPAFKSQNEAVKWYLKGLNESGLCLMDNLKRHPNPLTQLRLFNFFCIFHLVRYMALLEAFYCGENIASNGLISIPKFGADTQAIDNKKKGLIGTLFAASWYTRNNQDSLVASLDDDKARLWLQDSRFGNERADLVGLKYIAETNTLLIQPIEVKTRDESPDATITKSDDGRQLISGHAAGQIASIVGMLKEIFSVDENSSDMFISARREVLKYQIVSECFRNVHDSEWQKRWCGILKKAFGNGASGNINIQVSGLLMHIKLSEVSGGKVIQCAYADGDEGPIEYRGCPIEYRLLTAKEIQQEVLGEDTILKEPLTADYDSDETPESNEEGTVVYEFGNPSYSAEMREQTKSDAEQGTAIVENGTTRIEPIEVESQGKTGCKTTGVSSEEIEQLVKDFKRSCGDYHVALRECEAKSAVVGPSVIRIKFKLGRGQALQGLASHLEDIGREMKRTGVIIQQVPNSDELLLDVPRLQREKVLFKDVISSIPKVTSPEQLLFPLGRTPNGKDLIEDLSQMPHMLVGGSTGSGKSVFLFSMLAALLMTHPEKEDMQLILSSSKLEDFIHFEGLPHLYSGRIISDATEATKVIKEVIFEESERRGRLLAEARVANIVEYNKKVAEKLAPIVVVIDEFADLADQLETTKEKNAFYKPVQRIAQAGRSRGIHLVICTQRPEAKLVPSTTKAQLNGRVALRVNDGISSRMIIEEPDAQYLQKHGDMIYRNGDIIERAQGYLIEIEELDKIVDDVIHGRI